jgi:hypothetical protein
MSERTTFTYRYFAQEWGTFWHLCRDDAIDRESLERAFQALFYLSLHTDDPPPTSDTNIDQLLLAARIMYERRSLELDGVL